MSSPPTTPTSGRPAPGKTGATPLRKPKKAFANGLVALSSAAVIAIYAAGYARTSTAAEQLQAVAVPPTATTGATATTAPTATATATPTSAAPTATAAGGAATWSEPFLPDQ